MKKNVKFVTRHSLIEISPFLDMFKISKNTFQWELTNNSKNLKEKILAIQLKQQQANKNFSLQFENYSTEMEAGL